MEEVAAIKDIGNHLSACAHQGNAFRETDDARYVGLVMPRSGTPAIRNLIPYLSAALTMLKR